jgi:hypothetical protein
MIPSEHTSGRRQRLGAMSKQGNTLLRYLWCEAAMHAVERDPELKRFYRRKLVQKGLGKARVAAARKLGIRLWIMMRDQIDYQEFCLSDEDGIVIDEQFETLYFGGQDPIGKRVNFDILNITAEIVGVAGHVKQRGLDRDATNTIQAQFYFPLSQVPDRFMPLIARGGGFAVRTQGSPLAQTGAIRHVLEKLNSQIVMYDMLPMQNIIDDSLASRRFAMILLGALRDWHCCSRR